MRLAKLSEFRRLIYTPASMPALRTLRAWIDADQIPGGQKLGGRYFVDLDAYDRATDLRQGIEARRNSLAADPRLAGLI